MKKGYEEWGVVGIQAPIDANNADATVPSATTGIDMSLWSQLLFITSLGVLDNSATLDQTIKDSPTTNGTYAAISGKTKAIVGTDDGKVMIIALDASELNAGARYVRMTQDNSAHSQLVSVLVLGKAINPPATDNDLSVVGTLVD
jgi:hypothetical protein